MNTRVPFHMSCHAMITAKSKRKIKRGTRKQNVCQCCQGQVKSNRGVEIDMVVYNTAKALVSVERVITGNHPLHPLHAAPSSTAAPAPSSPSRSQTQWAGVYS